MTATLAAPTAAPTAPGTARPRLALALLALPSLLIAIDISVLTVALPRMTAALRPTPTELLWMNDVYGFMVGGTMVAMGALGDRIGRRRLIVVCSAVFALASAVAAFSVAPWMLIASRAVMGVAGAAIMPASMALLGVIFPDPRRSVSAMGAYMTCFLTGMAAAPLVGGLMIEHWWWGSVFLLGVPVMLVTVVAAPRLLPEYRAPGAGRVDVPSAALCLGALLLVVYAVKAAANHGSPLVVAGPAVVGVAAGVAFVRRQHRLADPLVDLGLLRRPGVARTLAVLFLTALVMGGTSLFVAFYLQTVQGLSPLRAALWLVPQMLAMIVAANLGPWLGRHVAPRRIVLAAFALMTVGFALFAVIPEGHGGLPVLCVASITTTAGIGAVFPYLMNGVIALAPPERAGAAASMAQTANEIGIAMGLVLLGTVGSIAYRTDLRARTGHASGTWVDGIRQAGADEALLGHVRIAFTSGLHTAAVVGVVVMVVVLVLGRRHPA